MDISGKEKYRFCKWVESGRDGNSRETVQGETLEQVYFRENVKTQCSRNFLTQESEPSVDSWYWPSSVAKAMFLVLGLGHKPNQKETYTHNLSCLQDALRQWVVQSLWEWLINDWPDLKSKSLQNRCSILPGWSDQEYR